MECCWGRGGVGFFGKVSLQARRQVEQLLRYIVEEASEVSENKQTFKFPFILMKLLFAFLKPDHPHGCFMSDDTEDSPVHELCEDEAAYSNYTDVLQWVDATRVLDLLVDKFNSSDSPEVHANTAEVLCAITRYAPPGFAAKICSPSFVGRLFQNALDNSRPKSVLVHSLSVCISLFGSQETTSIFIPIF
ncbi:hypothetical protein HPP92_009244 [Vanilla planifolia]|uniref:Uncharacterized protein n=1 Tax=Vanilla planifolia TaxID=51239 RepID=A0A835V4J3_VANPL|nr:hypothetical protein HPP92_009244 [Vanilla planifolia]